MPAYSRYAVNNGRMNEKWMDGAEYIHGLAFIFQRRHIRGSRRTDVDRRETALPPIQPREASQVILKHLLKAGDPVFLLGFLCY